MNQVIQNITGLNQLSDQVIAGELLSAAKSAIKLCASAITESATPEVHKILENELTKSIQMHDTVYQYVSQQGWYNAYDVNKQIQADIQSANESVSQINR